MHPFWIFLFTQYVYWYSKIQVWAWILMTYYKSIKTRIMGAGERFNIKHIATHDLYEVYDSHKDKSFIFTYEPETHKIDEHIITEHPFMAIGIKCDDVYEYSHMDKLHPIFIKGNCLSKKVINYVLKRGDDSPSQLSILDNKCAVSEINLETHRLIFNADGTWKTESVQ